MAERLGKSRLIMPSTSTLPTAMPAPASTEDVNKSGRLAHARSAVPRQISSMAPSSVRSTPKRRANAGAGAANRLPKTGRRLKAISSRHNASSQGRLGARGEVFGAAAGFTAGTGEEGTGSDGALEEGAGMKP